MPSTVTHSQEETIRAGELLGHSLLPGDVVACYGELGSGKTRFIKGLCKGLGVSTHVTSPTFTIVNEYTGAASIVYHFDFYRIESIGELREMGFDEYLQRSGVCLIEWAEKVSSLLPASRYDVRISFGADELSRLIDIDHVQEPTE